MQKNSGREPEVKTEVKFEVKSEVKVVNGNEKKKAPQEGKKKAEPHEGEQEQKKDRRVQQDSTKWRARTVNRKTVAQEERSGTKASGTCTTRTVSMAPAPVVEYIAPTQQYLCCCKGQVRDEMKGGSFASKYHPVSNEVPRTRAATNSTVLTSSQ